MSQATGQQVTKEQQLVETNPKNNSKNTAPPPAPQQIGNTKVVVHSTQLIDYVTNTLADDTRADPCSKSGRVENEEEEEEKIVSLLLGLQHVSSSTPDLVAAGDENSSTKPQTETKVINTVNNYIQSQNSTLERFRQLKDPTNISSANSLFETSLSSINFASMSELSSPDPKKGDGDSQTVMHQMPPRRKSSGLVFEKVLQTIESSPEMPDLPPSPPAPSRKRNSNSSENGDGYESEDNMGEKAYIARQMSIKDNIDQSSLPTNTQKAVRTDLKESTEAVFEGIVCDLSVVNRKLVCYDKSKKRYIGKVFPVDIDRVIWSEMNGRTVIVNSVPVKKGFLNNIGGTSIRKLKFEFINREKSAEWANDINTLTAKDNIPAMEKKAIILVDSKDVKNPIDLVNKYLKPVLDIAKKPADVMLVDFSQKHLVEKAFKMVPWHESNVCICIGQREVLSSVEGDLQEAAKAIDSSVNNFSCLGESFDVIDAALQIIKKPLDGNYSVACIVVKRDKRPGSFSS